MSVLAHSLRIQSERGGGGWHRDRRTVIELASDSCPSTHGADVIMFLLVSCAKTTACILARVTVEVRSNEIDMEIFLGNLLILY